MFANEAPVPRLRPSTPALTPFTIPERLQAWFAKATTNLAQPFKGISVDGTPAADLFPISESGPSSQPLTGAAEAFLASLDATQRHKACFPSDTDVWRSWNNMHPYIMRHGIGLHELSEGQRDLALSLLRETVSESAFETARNIMRLNHHLLEITGRDDEFGEWFYWLSIMGTPSSTEPWGWQIDGHHLTISCFVLGPQIVLTPTFMGSEPVAAQSGKYAGVRVFEVEEAQGLALMQELSPKQKLKATIGMQIPADVFAGSTFDNVVLPYQGVAFREMTAPQQSLLRQLVETYVGRLKKDCAAVKLEEIEKHLGETHFAWIGGHDDTSVFYYRVHGPTVLIEFDHQAGVALFNPVPTRSHIHTMVRTPNGNDFGRCLIQQHMKRGKRTARLGA
jgi:hypothetical protein